MIDDTIIGMLDISTDITERKKTEIELKMAKTVFISNMGHDIRTPLTGVIGVAEILENTLDNEEHKKALMIRESGAELLSMLNNVLDDIKAESIHDEEIPLAQQNHDALSPLLITKTDRPDSQSPYSLLVEDNATALIVLEALFSKAGYQFKSAKSGEEALDLIKSTTFDLIITDIGLPGISGTELCELTRKWEKEHNKKPQPIIGLTGHARETAYEECMASGMNDVFSKPANLELIHNLIKRYASDQSFAKSEPFESPPATIKEFPAAEAELFQLEQFSLFNYENGLKNCGGNEALFKEILILMISHELPADLEQMKLAFSLHDYATVEKLAHKIKGGGVYLGMTRLKYACQYVEYYWKTDDRRLFELLYHQAVSVIETSSQFISNWLNKKNSIN
ncbi:response regulator [Legionella sp.]|uniref:hybrid sensor histidine kinase/response regulator n=1 Tax=Legionella sp. TaxID=459 RepID=UPI003CA00CCE